MVLRDTSTAQGSSAAGSHQDSSCAPNADVTQTLETCPGTYSVPDSAIVEKQQFISTAFKRNQCSSLAQIFFPVKDAFSSK